LWVCSLRDTSAPKPNTVVPTSPPDRPYLYNAADYLAAFSVIIFHNSRCFVHKPYLNNDRSPAHDTNSRKSDVTDAFEEFHTDIDNKTSEVNDVNAPFIFLFRFLLSDGLP
jgi:hypothetical protein